MLQAYNALTWPSSHLPFTLALSQTLVEEGPLGTLCHSETTEVTQSSPSIRNCGYFWTEKAEVIQRPQWSCEWPLNPTDDDCCLLLSGRASRCISYEAKAGEAPNLPLVTPAVIPATPISSSYGASDQRSRGRAGLYPTETRPRRSKHHPSWTVGRKQIHRGVLQGPGAF